MNPCSQILPPKWLILSSTKPNNTHITGQNSYACPGHIQRGQISKYLYTCLDDLEAEELDHETSDVDLDVKVVTLGNDPRAISLG